MKKGFTLIELLAVIIILAVIALIATPIVLDVVNSAKESAAESSAHGFADAARLHYVENEFDKISNSNATTLVGVDIDDIEIQGEAPSSCVKQKVNENDETSYDVLYVDGKVKFTCTWDDTYTFTYENGELEAAE